MITLKFTYLKQPPRKYTFQMPKVKEWVEKRCVGKVLNLFAGKTLLEVNEVRVDIDRENAIADYYMDAFEFVSTWKGKKFDTVILDPPYRIRKSMEKYHGCVVSSYQKIRRNLVKILTRNATVISLGYNSSSIGLGFEKKEICLVHHGGAHNDTIILLEKRVGSIEDYFDKFK